MSSGCGPVVQSSLWDLYRGAAEPCEEQPAALQQTHSIYTVNKTVRKRETHLKKVTKNCTRSMMLLCCEKAIWKKGQRRKGWVWKVAVIIYLIISLLFSCLYINKHHCNFSQRLTWHLQEQILVFKMHFCSIYCEVFKHNYSWQHHNYIKWDKYKHKPPVWPKWPFYFYISSLIYRINDLLYHYVTPFYPKHREAEG